MFGFGRKKKKDLNLIFLNKHQIEKNCFIYQLHKTLKKNFSLNYLSLEDIKNKNYTPLSRNSDVSTLSVIPLRRWVEATPGIQDFLNENPINFYDQDPWEAYKDGAVAPGVYPWVYSQLNVANFLVTSNWWSEYISTRENLPTGFVRMGVLRENCSYGPPISKRRHDVGFQGTVHAHRKEFYDRLSTMGVNAELFKSVEFRLFLKNIQRIGIFLYNDSGAMSINGVSQPFHGLWGKALTVAARGCFVLRNFDEAYHGYDIHEVPSIYTFKTEDEIPGLVDEILSLSKAQSREIQKLSVDKIYSRCDWQTVEHFLR